MKINFLSISMLAIVGLVFSFCRTADPCESKSCSPNAECINGVCECIAASYKVGKGCVAKSSDTYYFGNKGCNTFLDTFTMKVTRDKNNASIASYERTSPTSIYNSTASTTGEYYPDKTSSGTQFVGDSIRVLNLFPEGAVKGVTCKNETTGRIKNSISGSTEPKIDVTVRFYDAKDIKKTIDVCKFTMKQ